MKRDLSLVYKVAVLLNHLLIPNLEENKCFTKKIERQAVAVMVRKQEMNSLHYRFMQMHYGNMVIKGAGRTKVGGIHQEEQNKVCRVNLEVE
ncbi:unnamed protein product [Euphydryas editha]|uniref:Uncharacterized protein n=1 Tax=Euphydryas editha TaxID=104508 RepID=A0AAU9V6K0_EUPED|nr:unnamed protein product [Euphydryas editha]